MIRFKSSFLIWLLRSRGKAIGIPNSGFGGLGMYFYDLICRHFGGRLINGNVVADWGRAGIYGTLGNYALPITSAEYELPINQWPHLLAVIFSIP
jgi:hypothetical protein